MGEGKGGTWKDPPLRIGIGSFSPFSRSFCILVGWVERNMSLRCCQNKPGRCGLFPKFMILDFQRGGLIAGYGTKFLKLLFYSLKNVIVTGGDKKLKCNAHTVEKMTKVPRGFDFSFLNDEEARKILEVLERNEELQRAEKARIRYRTNSFFLRFWSKWGASARSPSGASAE